MKRFSLTVVLAAFVLLMSRFALAAPVNIILDSDMADNVDDVGDQAVLWALANSGQANVLAVITSSTNDYSAATARVMANYFGHPNALIGAYQGNIPNNPSANFSYYTQQVVSQFGLPGDTRANYTDAVKAYRQALAGAANNSVYIVAGGFYEGLSGLLQSGPDSISSLTGSQLVAQKVIALVSASGIFPDSGNNPTSNFAFDPDGASFVFANWPVAIVSVGNEVGGDVITGPAASADPSQNPVKFAYHQYCQNQSCSDTDPAWTQVALLYAVRGLQTNFSVGGANGSTVVWNSQQAVPGRNIWSQTPNRLDSYIEKSISASQMANILNPMVQSSGSFSPVAYPQQVQSNGTAVPITLIATDGNHHSLTYTIASNPTHGTLSGTPPNVTYTPNSGFSGSDSFTFQAQDGSINSNIATVSISVGTGGGAITRVGQTTNFCNGGNCTSLSVPYTPAVGNSVLVFLWFSFVNPTSQVSVADNLGNALTRDQIYAGGYCASSFPCIQVWRQGVTPSGVSRYNINWSGADNTAAIVVEYSGLAAYDPAAFHGNDNGYNNGTAWTSGTGGTLSNAGDLLFCLAVDGRDSSQGWTQSGSFTTVLNANDSGTGALHLAEWSTPGTTAGQSCSGTVNVTGGQEILAVIGGYQPGTQGDQIVANSQQVQTDGNPLPITLTATDNENNPLTYVIVNSPTHGTLTGTPPNVTYTPTAGFVGSDSFTFQAHDAQVTSNIATVSITVTQDVAPVANPQQVQCNGNPLPITLTATDANGDPLIYFIDSNPANGSLSGTPPNVTYTPNAHFTGTDSFTFHASDGLLNSNIATVTIQVGSAGSISKVGQATNFCSGGSCTSLTVPYTPTQGNGVLVFVWYDFVAPVTGVTVKDSSNNALTLDQTYSGSYCASAFPCMQVWHQATAPAGVSSYNLHWTNADNAAAIVVEYTGLGSYDPSAFHANDNGYNSGTSWTTGTGGTLSNSGDLLFCFAVDGRDGSQTWTQSGIFSTVLNENASDTGALHVAQWINPGTTSGQSCSGSIGNTGGQEILAMIGGYQPGVHGDQIVANSQQVHTQQNVPLPVTLTATDNEGNPLTYSIVNQPANGSLSGAPPNVTYTPASGFIGTDSFTFQATDGQVNSNVATITIQVGAAGSITRVGQATNFCSGGSCTSLSVPYVPTAGNSTLLFLYFSFVNPTTSVAVTDSRGNALTLDKAYAGGYCASAFNCIQVWREASVPSGVTSYNIHWSNADNTAAVVVEYSGLGAYDTPAFHGNDNGYNGGTSWTSGTGGTLSNSGDLLFCFAVDGRDSAQNWTVAGNFTSVLNANDSATGAILLAEWKNPGTTAGQSCSGTISVTGGQEILAIIGGYQPAH